MDNPITQWRNGAKDGIAIGIGYFAVSFTFGIMAKNAGLSPAQAVIMSITNLTSAGQFAALKLIGTSSTFVEMAVTQLVLNLRYCLMSCAISQKLDGKTAFLHRFFVAHGVTDEIFGVSVCKKGKLSPLYNYGVMSAAVPGWTLGTLCGVLSGSLLPERMVSALGIALYAMFVAVMIPPAKNNKLLSGVILFSMLLSLLCVKISAFSHISAGCKIIGLTVFVAGFAAVLFPIKEDTLDE